MRQRLWIAVLSLAVLVCGYLLWLRLQTVDSAMAERVQIAENERHELVISHDFDHIKEKLIEVHRDLWIELARQEQQARIEAICLGGVLLLFLLLMIREFRRNTPKKS